MQALLDVAACSIITLGSPFVVGLEDGPFISFPVVFAVHGVQSVSIRIKFRMTFIQPMKPPFTSWTYSWESLPIRSSIIFSGLCWHVALFFHMAGPPTVKTFGISSLLYIKGFQFCSMAIDLISVYVFKYSIREPVSRIGLSTDRHSP